MVQDASIIKCAYRSPSHLVKMQVWIHRSQEELEILHIGQALRWHCCCWSMNHTLSSKEIVYMIH